MGEKDEYVDGWKLKMIGSKSSNSIQSFDHSTRTQSEKPSNQTKVGKQVKEKVDKLKERKERAEKSGYGDSYYLWLKQSRRSTGSPEKERRELRRHLKKQRKMEEQSEGDKKTTSNKQNSTHHRHHRHGHHHHGHPKEKIYRVIYSSGSLVNPTGLGEQEHTSSSKQEKEGVALRRYSRATPTNQTETTARDVSNEDFRTASQDNVIRRKSTGVISSLSGISDSVVAAVAGSSRGASIARQKTRMSMKSSFNPFRHFLPFHDDEVEMISRRLQEFYTSRPVKVEEQLKYFELIEAQLTETYFRHKPIVLVVGEVCTGKTSFINHLLGNKKYIGSDVDEDRSTNRFSVIDKGKEDESVSGRNLVSDPKRPFRELNTFGNDFMENLQHVLVSEANVLDNCYLIDTPGLVKGSTKAKDGYEMRDVIKWFANAADTILLVWDAHRWRMSDAITELFRNCLHKHYSKLVIVLNKCDLLQTGTSQFTASPTAHLRQNSRQVVANQVLWMISKFFSKPQPITMWSVSMMPRPLPATCDVEVIEACHQMMYRSFMLMRRTKCQNIVNCMEARLKRCYATILIVRELHSKLGHLGKTKKKQEILESFDKFLQDVDAKAKHPFTNVIKTYLNVSDLKKNLAKFDFNSLPKTPSNQVTLTIESMLIDVVRIIPHKFFEMKVEIPTEEEEEK